MDKTNETSQSNTNGISTSVHQEQPNSSNFLRVKVENTPFEIIGSDEKGYFLAMGRIRLSDMLPSKFKVEEYMIQNKWELTSDMICALAELVYMRLQEGREKSIIPEKRYDGEPNGE